MTSLIKLKFSKASKIQLCQMSFHLKRLKENLKLDEMSCGLENDKTALRVIKIPNDKTFTISTPLKREIITKMVTLAIFALKQFSQKKL